MPNMHDAHSSTKKEELSQEIRELEIQIMAEKGKLNSAENDQRLEDNKKIFLEVRKNELKQNIDFYKINGKKMRNKLTQRSTIHSKFLMAQQCYDKLLKIYAENLLQTKSKMQSGNEVVVPNKHIMDFQKQAENLQKQIELLRKRIDENYFTINNLLESLQFPIE